MKSVSITLPDIFINGFDRLVQANVIRTRADGMRIAVIDFLRTLDDDWNVLLGPIPMEGH